MRCDDEDREVSIGSQNADSPRTGSQNPTDRVKNNILFLIKKQYIVSFRYVWINMEVSKKASRPPDGRYISVL